MLLKDLQFGSLPELKVSDRHDDMPLLGSQVLGEGKADAFVGASDDYLFDCLH